mmetsp:Transcript_25389/g.62487  ORF Transcript_25389/g.62487 Transcript_25389/m.62487 type:complete len:398 (-) Transcript_25389:86-1279(-)
MAGTEEEKKIEEKKEVSAGPKQDGEDDASKKKRMADRQITKDDGEDDGEDDGDAKLDQPFEKASEEVLSKRKILKVKRPANGGPKPGSNPFQATKLTTSDTKASDSGPKVFGGSSAFSGFGGFGSSSSSTSGGFGSSSAGGFGSAFGTSSAFGSALSSSGGFGAKASSSTDEDAAKTTTSLFGKPTGSTGFSFGFAKTSTAKKDSESSATPAAVTLPENVKLTTGEEDEVKMHEVRCKSFKMVAQEEARVATEERKESANPSVKPSSNFENKNQESSKSTDDKEGDEKKGPQHRWQEVGTGPLKILRSTDHGDKFRMVQRQESSKNGPAHKVILNVPLWKEAACAKLSDKQLRLTTPGSGESLTYTLKFKEAGEALAFSECIQDVCEEAKSCFASSN